MIYLLDTDTVIHLARGMRIVTPRNAGQRERQKTAQRIVARCRKLQAAGDDLCVSAITVAELEFGARNSEDYAVEAAAVRKILTPFTIQPFDPTTCPVEYGLIRHELESAGVPIGAMDMLIGAHAKAMGAILVTHNSAHFGRIRGLKCETWAD